MIKDAVEEYLEAHSADLKQQGFKIHQVSNPANSPAVRGRRDFYKLGIVTGNMTIYYGDKTVALKGTSLFFVNPKIPHHVLTRSKRINGYACLFTETFITGIERTEILKRSPLYRLDISPAISLNQEQAVFINGLFEKMRSVYNGNYPYKNEILRSCLELIMHEADKLQPVEFTAHHSNGLNRVAHLFLDLLERQFPIESPVEPLKLRTAHDFGQALSLHTNYLNRAVKEVTGKPTSVHIAERIAAEAKALLQHTDWSVAEIGYALGFEYPTYFSMHFKRLTGATPNSLRKE